MMERVKRSLNDYYWSKRVSCLLAWCLIVSMSAPAVWALESGNIISQTGVIGTPTWGDNTVINTDHQAIINWNNFNTSSTQSVTFNQYKSGELNSTSAVLNRISSGAVPTQCDGALNANGRVFIINPAGIAFGAGSHINVTQLVASGLNMSDTNFLDATDGTPADFVFEGGNGEVTNRGVISADSVFLVGKKVVNISAIVANDGLVVMAAGENVYIAQDGSNVAVQVSDGYYTDSIADVRNRSLIRADDGKIVLAAGDTFSRAVSNVGILAASGGEISMQAAQVNNNGQVSVSSSGNGGSVSLTGAEGVSIGPDGIGNPGRVEADAGPVGDGGSVTIQTDGLFRLNDTSWISADGGGVSGNGGSVTINCNDFEIAGDISAAPGNKTEEPGTLEINTPSNVIIADGANAGATDTLYEDDIETLSQEATSLIVNAQEGITVKDITDGLNPGEITGQFGDIELHATGDDSAVSFADNTDTIRTTLGDIVIEAGSGGIDVGNLTTGKDITDEKPTPGQILLSTNNGGNITTGDLTIRDGWGHAEINIDSSGDLTVNGDVIAGSESDILNVADQKAAEAVIKLSADNDVVLNGVVEAHANGIEEDTSTTKATIDIIAGNNATINGNIIADAKTSSSGTADAVVNIETVGDITFAEGVEVHATADDAAADSTGPDYESDEETNTDGDHAQIIINESGVLLEDDNFTTPKYVVSLQLDVLANDTVDGETISSYTQPTAGTLTPNMSGDKIVGFTYTPPEDLHTLTFNEAGEATVTFTYTVNGHTATATITLTNGLPTADGDLVSAFENKAIKINVLANDTDPDKDALTPILGTVTTKNGTLVLNEDHTFTYTPDEGYLGDDSFMYSVTDGYNTSSEVEVKITVSVKPPEPPTPPALPYVQNAPGLDRLEWINVEVSGCPALVKWAAEEVGIDKRLVQIWVSSSLASTGDIQPCDACERLRNAAKILQDADGTHIAALTQVVNEFASSTAPPTEEQMTAIADAIRRNTDEESYYAVANEYLDALVTYVGVLTSDMGFSSIESVQLVTDKYISRLTQEQNVGVAAFLAASLAALGG
jgi:filamentous hemagglutinin family protein